MAPSPYSNEGVQQGNNLVFTNLFQQDSSEEVASVVFYDFYNEVASEALYQKRILFEIEAGVMVNVTLETAENLPTFEQRKWEVFGEINPLVFIVPILAAILIGSIAWLCWYKKWYKSLILCTGKYQLVPGTRLQTKGKANEYEPIPTWMPEEPLIDIDQEPSYKILSDLPPAFPMIEKRLPIFQGLLRLQNFNVGDRYCGSCIECLEGTIPLPHVLVRALFAPQANCIRVLENGTDFAVALPTESVMDVASVLLTLCLPKRPVPVRTDVGEIRRGIRRIIEVLRPACAKFIEQERNSPAEVVETTQYLSARFLRFVLRMRGEEYQAVVNTECQFRLLDEPESALGSLDELRMRIQGRSRPLEALPPVGFQETLQVACLEDLIAVILNNL